MDNALADEKGVSSFGIDTVSHSSSCSWKWQLQRLYIVDDWYRLPNWIIEDSWTYTIWHLLLIFWCYCQGQLWFFRGNVYFFLIFNCILKGMYIVIRSTWFQIQGHSLFTFYLFKSDSKNACSATPLLINDY